MDGELRTYQEMLASGMSRQRLRDQVAAGRVEPVVRSVYGPAVVDQIDRLQATLLRLPSDVLLSHQSAAALFGFALAPRAIHVTFPAGMAKPRLDGVIAHEAVLPVGAPMMHFGVRCTPPARAAIDLARSGRRFDGIAVLDAALRTGLVDADGLAVEVVRHGKLRGVRQARELVPLADGGAECAQESHLRLLLVDGRLPAPRTQVWARSEQGSGVYRLDLAYEDKKVGVEYDGASHLDPAAMHRDRRRANWLAAHGWIMRHFTARDLYGPPGHVVRTVYDALRLR
ncbi:DUF559 domain-containing protein [Dactylosporangium sucinum]|uniref:DUF559 domain-containing protein n=1 Tax=Dactylosporangium sucinum TaxID=1424081 RepID=A0A917TRQ9_9ACTN|nr:DUF559 domain-containing protein [Dactylosporangium sucinum]GGM34356.1 hypothetical protein GCM10007977_039890 [Dactylosporangium sucinum]